MSWKFVLLPIILYNNSHGFISIEKEILTNYVINYNKILHIFDIMSYRIIFTHFFYKNPDFVQFTLLLLLDVQ